ncbi:peptide ABC transporter substrate-binding protein [Bacillus massiliglaciei]|uniref:peptide ABC transporter substrate-binding protein n=1 Tax=Bacillus massiliglaciei TaxID=1816693 RepID=UPI000A4D9777|nr:peptide ABC transporter substrate-binding protein [Bacillus massiliglaciei]
MKNSKYSLLLVLTLAISVFLAACGGKDNGSEDGSNPKQEITILNKSEIPTMDSAKVTDQYGIIYLSNVNEGLYTLDKEGNAVPGLVDGEPEVNDDQTVYTFKLKETKWSNGEPVTANDFVFAWQRAMDPDTASEYGPYMMNGKIKGAQEITDAAAAKKEYDLNSLGVKAIDDKTLEVTFEKPLKFWKDFLAFPTFLPQNEKFVKEKGSKYATSADNLLYNGPFVMTKWDGPTAQNWELAKNPDYREADQVKLEKISVNVVKDDQGQVNAFESGEADITDVLASDLVPQYEGDDRMLSQLDASVYWLKMNQKTDALANVHIREAIAKGFNKEDLVASILNNGSVAANYFVPKDFVEYDGKDFRDKYPDLVTFNEKEAKAAWEKGLKELGVKELTLRYLGGDTESSKKMDEYLKNQLEKNLPGLTVKLESVPFSVRLDRTTKGNYDLVAAGWGPDYKDAISFTDLWLTGSPNNEMSYSNKKYDDLIKKATTEYTDNDAKYAETMQEAEKLFLTEDFGVAPIYQRANNILVNTNVKGLVSSSVGADYLYRWVTVE